MTVEFGSDFGLSFMGVPVIAYIYIFIVNASIDGSYIREIYDEDLKTKGRMY